jgi:hypothetical protein
MRHLGSNIIYLATVLFLSSATVLQNMYFTFKAIRKSNGSLIKYLEAYSRPLPYCLVAPAPPCPPARLAPDAAGACPRSWCWWRTCGRRSRRRGSWRGTPCSSSGRWAASSPRPSPRFPAPDPSRGPASDPSHGAGSESRRRIRVTAPDPSHDPAYSMHGEKGREGLD